MPLLVDIRGELADLLVRQGRREEAIALLQAYDDFRRRRREPAYFEAQIGAIRDGHAPAGISVEPLMPER